MSNRPNIAPYRPELTLPTDGSNFGAQINAFTADCKNHGYNAGYLKPGWVGAETDVQLPSNFDLIGMGKYEQGNYQAWGGGVKIVSPLNSTKPAVSAIGTTGTPGTITGMVERPGVMNVTLGGAASISFAISRAMPAILDMQHVYRPRIENVFAGNDFIRALRLTDVWDCNIFDFWSSASAGFSDASATSDSAAQQLYTERAWMSAEIAAGRSYGVPAVEIFSPNTTGNDVSNNIRFYGLFLEGDGENGVPFMAHGGNTGAIQVFGGKIEALQGIVPLIVLDGVHGFYYRGWLFAGGQGSGYFAVPANTYGSPGFAAGTPWANYATSDRPAKGALVHASQCFSPTIEGNGGNNGGGAARYTSFFHFSQCEDPRVAFNIEDGLATITTARMVFDACAHVSTSHTRCYAYNYLLTVSGANQNERSAINGTTVDA